MLGNGVEDAMRSTLSRILLSIAVAAGCGVVEYRGTVAVSATLPDLVAVAPGVQVIADYDEPIFFVDGLYWWFFDGFWYRSASYTGGWAYAAVPPVVIVGIHKPHLYRHYRPPGYVVHHRPVPLHRVQRPVVRDHRSDGTRIRDHRR
jgi:hypothetical protein